MSDTQAVKLNIGISHDIVPFAVMLDTACPPLVFLVPIIIEIILDAVSAMIFVIPVLEIITCIQGQHTFSDDLTLLILENIVNVAQMPQNRRIFIEKLQYIGICDFLKILDAEPVLVFVIFGDIHDFLNVNVQLAEHCIKLLKRDLFHKIITFLRPISHSQNKDAKPFQLFL